MRCFLKFEISSFGIRIIVKFVVCPRYAALLVKANSRVAQSLSYDRMTIIPQWIFSFRCVFYWLLKVSSSSRYRLCGLRYVRYAA